MRPGVVPAEVRRVRKQFEGWRADKQPRERIPAALWAAAASLCETYSAHRVSRWLHLNQTALQKRASRRGRIRPSEPKPTFVEWSLPAGIVPGPFSAEYIVEVKGRVPRIHVRGASASEVAALVGALDGQSRGA
jgi:hypothetical protein